MPVPPTSNPAATILRVLSVSSEAVPMIKTGGLADVCGALPGALRGAGVAMTTFLPGYRAVRAKIGLPTSAPSAPDASAPDASAPDASAPDAAPGPAKPAPAPVPWRSARPVARRTVWCRPISAVPAAKR